MRNKSFPFLLFVFFTLLCASLSGQNTVVSSWKFAGIANGFDGVPNHQYFAVAEPEIKRLDPQGGELWFTVTSKSFPSCKQVFRVGWVFKQPVNTLTEGQTVNVQVFNWPVGDSGGVGYRECYLQGKQWANDQSYFTINFQGGSFCHLHKRLDYAKYWSAQTPLAFSTKPEGGIFSLPVNPGFNAPVGLTTGSLVVKSFTQQPGQDAAAHNSFTISISKGEVFRYNVVYLFDGKAGPRITASVPLILETPEIRHNIPNEDGVYFMQLSLPGSIQNSAGRSLRIVMRFCDANGRPLPAAPDEPTYRDQQGYVASASEVVLIPDNAYSLDQLDLWLPYEALNLPKTGYTSYTVQVYAEIFLDGKSVGISEKAPIDVLW